MTRWPSWVDPYRGGRGGMSALPEGTLVVREPAPDGSWPARDRPEGVRWQWMRPLSADRNAALPAWDDGYEAGDIVYPVTGDEELRLPFRGLRWSESFNTGDPGSSVVGRLTDSYAGGQSQYMWGMSSGAGPGARAIIAWETGLDLYDTAFLYPDRPALPIDGPWKVTFQLRNESASHNGGIIIAGAPADQAARRVVVGVNGSGGDKWTISHGPDSWAPPVTLGATPRQPIWTEASIEKDGAAVTVTHGDTTWRHTLTTEAAALPDTFGFWSGRWGTFAARNIRFEAL